MEQIRSLETNRLAASQEIPHILWNQKVYYRVSPVVSFAQVSLPKTCTRLYSPPYVLHAPPISYILVYNAKPSKDGFVFIFLFTVHYFQRTNFLLAKARLLLVYSKSLTLTCHTMSVTEVELRRHCATVTKKKCGWHWITTKDSSSWLMPNTCRSYAVNKTPAWRRHFLQ
jgi:hypothetical protein